MPSDPALAHPSSIWTRLPNEATKSRLSPTRAEQDQQQYHQHSHEFDPSPRSSISSSTFSATASSSTSPGHSAVQLPPGLFLEPSRSPQQRSSPRSAPSSALYPEHSLPPPFTRKDSYNSNASYDPSPLSVSSTGTASASTAASSQGASGIPTPNAGSSTEPQTDHTQAALAEIFGGQVRPHFRSSSVVSPRPEVSPPESARSYFSPPAPKSPVHSRPPARPRSQSSAPALDPSYRQAMNQSNGVYNGGQGGQQLQYQHADQYGYRPSSSNSNYSSSLPSNGPGPKPIGISNQEDRSPSRPRLGPFTSGSYNGGGGGGALDQTGWKANGSRQAASFGWEDADREGRSRSRDEQQRPWGEPEFSHASGIGLSNMSPFTRDGGRTLADVGEGAAAYKARRDYSLGAVGSGRKRSDSEWGRDRTLKEAEDEEEDAFAPPTKSGATSRRHSFAAFNPPSRSQIGFNLPEEDADVRGVSSSGNFGSNALSGGYGTGSSAINDDDLAADLNSLHLNLEAHVAAVDSSTRQEQQRLPPVGSMPTDFPPSRSSRRFEDSSAHSNSPPATSAAPLRSPPIVVSTASSRFFHPQPSAPTTSLTPSTASRMGSRFEFGGASTGSTMGGGGGGGSLALNDFGLPNFGGAGQGYGGGQQQQQQQAPNRYMPSFGLPPPSPPNSYYSTPLNAPGLSAQAPAFQGYSGQKPALHHQQQQQQQQQHHAYFSTGAPPPQQQQQTSPGSAQSGGGDLVNLGRGVPLHTVPANAPLYIVEFKAGRKDLFFVEDPNLQLRQGDLVIVEADRGRDIGKYFKPCSLDEVQAFQQRLVEMALGQLANPGQGGQGPPPPNAAALARMTKEFQPKRLYSKALPADTHQLLSKAQDEVKALALVRSKVAQKNLPMEVCDAEWQWDRRKLTFYYTADTRVDFRELVRELFRVYKTRVWMCCLDQQSGVWDFK